MFDGFVKSVQSFSLPCNIGYPRPIPMPAHMQSPSPITILPPISPCEAYHPPSQNTQWEKPDCFLKASCFEMPFFPQASTLPSPGVTCAGDVSGIPDFMMRVVTPTPYAVRPRVVGTRLTTREKRVDDIVVVVVVCIVLRCVVL